MAKLILNEIKGSTPFWVCLFVSIALLVFGAIVPPMGVIDGSLLTAVGELFAFAALWAAFVAIEKGIDTKVTHKNTTIQIGDLNDNGTETSEE